jgi:SnoaL-like polyketide cyclase
VVLMVAEGDLVSVVWVFRGTHTHAGYGGLPPTGARIEMRGITVWRIVDGKIREEWTEFNEMRGYGQMLSQLKWPLVGLIFLVLILLWGMLRVLRRLLTKRWSEPQPGVHLHFRRSKHFQSEPRFAVSGDPLSLFSLEAWNGSVFTSEILTVFYKAHLANIGKQEWNSFT